MFLSADIGGCRRISADELRGSPGGALGGPTGHHVGPQGPSGGHLDPPGGEGAVTGFWGRVEPGPTEDSIISIYTPDPQGVGGLMN